MAVNNDFLFRKWSIISHQLIALCAMDKLPGTDEVFAKILAEELSLKDLNSKLFTALCYYILGIINVEQRDNLIRWPVTNIQSQSKFRKGVSLMISSFQDKYPWANLKKVPESYFLNPHVHQAKVIEFLSKLTNLAIHKVLNDSKLLTMHSGKGITNKDIGIMRNLVTSVTLSEEELIRSNLILLKDFEDAKNDTCNKCIALKQANNNLQQQLDNFTSQAVSEGITASESKIEVEDLREKKNSTLSELSTISEELQKYFSSSQELLKQIKTVKNPVTLTAENFGSKSEPPDLMKATAQASKNLYQFFQYINSKNSTKEEEEAFYQMLLKTKKCLTEEKKAFEMFLSSVPP